MYINLQATLLLKDISIRQYAEFLGVSEEIIKDKINGVTDFSYHEFKKTCNILFPGYNADNLFADEQSDYFSSCEPV